MAFKRKVAAPKIAAASPVEPDVPVVESAPLSATVDALFPVTTRDPQYFQPNAATTSVARGREHNHTNR